MAQRATLLGLVGMTAGDRLDAHPAGAHSVPTPECAGFGIRLLAISLDAIPMPAYGEMASSDRSERLGDRWGQTVVVRTASLPKSARPSAARVFGGIVVAWLATTALWAGGFLLDLIWLAVTPTRG
jgi:hypothetical protein